MRAMYEHYWNLTCRPFEGHFSPAFFYESETHQAARLKLRYLVESGWVGRALRRNRHGQDGGCRRVAARAWLKPAVRWPISSFRKCLQPLSSPTWRRSSVLRNAADARRESIGRCPDRDAASRIVAAGEAPVIIVDEAHLIDDVRRIRIAAALA